jgi:hypothetical protein
MQFLLWQLCMLWLFAKWQAVCRYADALGDTFLFFEAQHSGPLNSNAGGNRIKWKGQQLMKDGQDVGLDMTGGMYEAGSVPLPLTKQHLLPHFVSLRHALDKDCWGFKSSKRSLEVYVQTASRLLSPCLTWCPTWHGSAPTTLKRTLQ